MSGTLLIKNRQRAISLDTRLLKSITQSLLSNQLKLATFELGISIVRAPDMACVNETFLQHEGSTDVITFDHSEPAPGTSRPTKGSLHGEIFISIDDAIRQAKEFRTTWQSELARYVVHGVLHLRGFDDLNPLARRKMKQEENRLLKELASLFPLSKLGRTPKLAP